jgi:hypothetical protein
MATTVKNTKYFYPPRPGSGAATFSDNIVGLQIVEGGGLTQGNFEFTTKVVDKVNRNFGVGAFSNPINLEDLNVSNVAQSRIIQRTQFGVYPVFDTSQVTNFSLYGSLSKRFGVSVTKIINYFPASIDVMNITPAFTQGDTAVNIAYDSVNDETYFEVNVDRIFNPFEIDYTSSADRNIAMREMQVSVYRNLSNTYLDYAVSINGLEYKIESFQPSDSFFTGYISFYVSGAPFGTTATTITDNFSIRPNDFVVDKIFAEQFDEIENFLLNRLVVPEYTAVFQVPLELDNGQFTVNNQKITWPKDGPWNLDIRNAAFDDYISLLQQVAETMDSFKTNLISRFLTSGSLKEFDTIGRKVEKVFQLYGRSFDDIKKYIDGLAFMNSVNYNPSNDIPNELLVDLAKTLGWGSNFSPITNDNFLDTIFGVQTKSNYPGYTRALTSQELNYAFYRNLILNSAYIFKSKGTRRSVEFLLNLIGAPESLIEYNEHVEVADRAVDMEFFNSQFARITGGTYVDEVPQLQVGQLFKLKGQTFTAFTNQSIFETVNVTRGDYPVDEQGYPKSPIDSESFYFQKGAGWYEQTPQHRSSEELVITNQLYQGQNPNIQTQLKPFTYGEDYLSVFRRFPYIYEGFRIDKTIDNNKSWVSTDDKLRQSTDANYNSYYYINDEKLVLNVKNVDLFLNPGQGLTYEIWLQSRNNNYPIPSSGLTVNYPEPGGVDSTVIDPDPQTKTFFEFKETFWQNMINARNRQFITDGKTGGYPTLQSLFWKYIQQYQNIGIQNNQYTYQKLIDYVSGMGTNWMKLVEQMIPASTLWQGGTRLENSVLHRQKFVYRRQRGCIIQTKFVDPCRKTASLVNYGANDEKVTLSIYPWFNASTTVTSFSAILNKQVEELLVENGTTISLCNGINTLRTEWYVDIKIGETQLIQYKFYDGVGLNGYPTDGQWKLALKNSLPDLLNYNLWFNLNGNNLTITNLTNQTLYLSDNLTLDVGININVNC